MSDRRFCIAAVMQMPRVIAEIPDMAPRTESKGKGAGWSRECNSLRIGTSTAANVIEISCISM